MKKNTWSTPGFENRVLDLVADEYLDTEIVLLLQGTNLFGNQVYAYIKLTGRKVKEMFAKMRQGENFKPSDFGTVLVAGSGTPTQEVKDEMKTQYNMLDVPAPVNRFANMPAPKFFDDNG